jgi:hypothetical protein
MKLDAIELWQRAARAAAEGEKSFALPEGQAVVAEIRANSPDAAVRRDAEAWAGDYHSLVRLAARAVLALGRTAESEDAGYVAKAAGELEPMLALWPHVLLFPTVKQLSMSSLMKLRPFPLHVLAVSAATAWADGRFCSPADSFFHDLDHARFKLREDLQLLGISIPDAYRDGTTFDAATGKHRMIVAHARAEASLWAVAEGRHAWICELLAKAKAIPDRALAAAVELLLFEVLHEKSHPAVRAVLQRELGSDAHLQKLRRKLDAGFFGPASPAAEVRAALEPARAWLEAA